jgi:hypothetical protein
MRARKVSDEQIIELYRQGLNQSQIGAALDVSNVAIHKRLKRILVMASLEKLTPKEQQFCIAVSEGKTRTQAALEAYDCSGIDSAKTVQRQLMQKEEIQQSISALMDIEGLTRGYKIRILKSHVDNKADPHVSLKALDMSFKLVNDYPPQRNINLNADFILSPVDLERYRNR